MKTISFSILFSTLQLFFNPLFLTFLQQFTAGENLKVAGDSAGRRGILTTLVGCSNLKHFDFEVTEKYYADCTVRKNLSTSCFQLEPSPRLSRLL